MLPVAYLDGLAGTDSAPVHTNPPPPDAGPNRRDAPGVWWEPADLYGWAVSEGALLASDAVFRDAYERHGLRYYEGPEYAHRTRYTPAIDANDGWRAHLWQLQAMRVGYTENERD